MSHDEHRRTERTGRPVLLALAGFAITFAGAVTYFTVFARVPALRDFPWVNLPLAVAGVAIATFAAAHAFRRPTGLGARIATGTLATLSVLLAGLFASYLFWISYQIPDPSEIATTISIAPETTLLAPDGNPVTLGEFRGKKVLVVFYRGFW
jgi:hypothetical protein